MENIYLIGASGHAKVVADILLDQQRNITRVFEKNEAIKRLWHIEVLPQPEKEKWPIDGVYIIAVGNNSIRKLVAESYQDELKFTTAIHRSAVVSTRTSVGEGTVVMAGVTINVETKIGKHVIVNTNCSIDHECVINDYVHISPQVALAGDVCIGEGSHIGIGACIIQGIKIGKWATIGAGAVVIRDVPDYAVVVGNPGRVIKYNEKKA